METCTIETGMLFWKKVCGAESAGNCHRCGRVVCGLHAGRMGDSSILCVACFEQNPSGDSAGSRSSD